MKSLTLILVLIMITSATSTAQKLCCNTAASSFAALSHGEEFRDAHDVPPAYQHQGRGTMQAIRSADGVTASFYDVASADGSKGRTILMFHEWWGLNDHIKREADRLADALGHTRVIAVDLYDGMIATTRSDAATLMQENDEARSTAIVNAIITSLPPGEKIGTIGWCFGGGWSHRATLLAGQRAAACVIYYGMPEQDRNALMANNAPVLFIHADQDKWITPAIVGEYESTMKTLGKSITVVPFNADHAFANPSGKNFDSDATATAWKASVEFFQANVK
jgi:carboxymethylenebutenolidase